MRRPRLQDCDDGDGNGPDLECYYEAMSRYEDEERDRQLEEEMDRKEEKERHADYSDQEKDNEKA